MVISQPLAVLYWLQHTTQPSSMSEDGFIVRARGLPWSATAEDIVTFFSGEYLVFFSAERSRNHTLCWEYWEVLVSYSR